MEEAARRLGVSVATVRRRLHGGELQGFQQPTSQGFKWLVKVPEDSTADTRSKANSQTDSEGISEGMFDSSSTRGEVAALRETIGILKEELETRHREVQELHVLLQQQAQAALPAPKENRHSWWRFWGR